MKHIFKPGASVLCICESCIESQSKIKFEVIEPLKDKYDRYYCHPNGNIFEPIQLTLYGHDLILVE